MSASRSVPDFSSYPKVITEFAGAEYIGPQEALHSRLHLFRDPQTGSTLALRESELTLARVEARLAEFRAEFRYWRPAVRQ